MGGCFGHGELLEDAPGSSDEVQMVEEMKADRLERTSLQSFDGMWDRTVDSIYFRASTWEGCWEDCVLSVEEGMALDQDVHSLPLVVGNQAGRYQREQHYRIQGLVEEKQVSYFVDLQGSLA